MKPANDPLINYKLLVQQGYDRCAVSYHNARWTKAPAELSRLTSRLKRGDHVLDVGCGAGVPVTRDLAKGFTVTGVDFSQAMIQLARCNVPDGTFIQADTMSAEFPPSRFDGVVAFYSVFHLPREEHEALFRRIHGWLKPGGYFLATLTNSSQAAYTEDGFFGVTMFWSNYGIDEYKDKLISSGFAILENTATGDGYAQGYSATDEVHPVVLALKLGITPRRWSRSNGLNNWASIRSGRGGRRGGYGGPVEPTN